jgi:hypothetical protein
VLITGLGATTTAVVTVVIAATKFREGAWAVMVFVPVMVWLLVRMNHLYERERRELSAVQPLDDGPRDPPRVVIVVDELDRAAMHAIQYARTIRTRRVRAVHVDVDKDATVALVRRWAELRTGIPLDLLPADANVATAIGRYVRRLPDDTDISVILPSPADPRAGDRLRRTRLASGIERQLLDVERARLTVVRDHPAKRDDALAPLRVAAARGHRAVVLVDKADRATMRAIRYARSLGADEVTAVHAAADHDRERELIRRWMELRVPIPLDVIECWDRNVPRSLEQYVVDLMSHRYEVTVVMPRRDYATVRQRILHDRTSRMIARAVGRYEHVDVAVVPYFFRRANGHPLQTGAPSADPGVSDPAGRPAGDPVGDRAGVSVPSTDGATGSGPDAR